jgi:uncharacterized protein (TIGR00730 family)
MEASREKTIDQVMATAAARPSPTTPKFDVRVRELVRDCGAQKSAALLEEMITTALEIGRDEMGVADLKLINRSMKEMRSAARIFAPFKHLRKVAVFGSARTQSDSLDYKMATDFACEMVRHKFMLITGGSDGLMGAVQKGAGRAHSFALNIRLRSDQRIREEIEDDPKLITLNYFFTRKLSFVREAHAFAVFPGGFGTLDEAFEVLTLIQTGKARIAPVVLLDQPGGKYWETWVQCLTERLLECGFISEEDFAFFKIKHSVQEAAGEITRFYKIFHSSCWVGERFVIRLNEFLSPEAIADLNTRFADVVRHGEIAQRSALPEEKSELEVLSLPRLVFRPIRSRFGRFRQLIDAINSSPPS